METIKTILKFVTAFTIGFSGMEIYKLSQLAGISYIICLACLFIYVGITSTEKFDI